MRLSQLRCIEQRPQDRRQLAETKLLGKPFAKLLFYFFLYYRALGISGLETLPHLFNDIQMILYVLN